MRFFKVALSFAVVAVVGSYLYYLEQQQEQAKGKWRNLRPDLRGTH